MVFIFLQSTACGSSKRVATSIDQVFDADLVSCSGKQTSLVMCRLTRVLVSAVDVLSETASCIILLFCNCFLPHAPKGLGHFEVRCYDLDETLQPRVDNWQVCERQQEMAKQQESAWCVTSSIFISLIWFCLDYLSEEAVIVRSCYRSNHVYIWVCHTVAVVLQVSVGFYSAGIL